MAKRHTDKRFIVQSHPSLFRLTGKPANAALRLSTFTATCQAEDCDNYAHTSLTVQTSTGIAIKRYCTDHTDQYHKKPKKRIIPDEVLELIRDMQRRDMSTWHADHRLTQAEPPTVPTGNIDPHTGKPTYRAV